MTDILVASGRIDELKGELSTRIGNTHSVIYADSVEGLSIEALNAEVAFGAPDILPELLPQMPNLRWVQSTWAGVTPFIQASRRDYCLTGIKGLFGASMSEYVLAWTLGLERSVLKHAQATHWEWLPDRGVSGLRMGIAGMGDIGAVVAQRCAPFFAEVVGLNRDGRDVDGCSRCFPLAQLDEFAKELDVLVMLLPDTPATSNLIGASVLAHMRRDSILINAGRGQSLDLPAALQALKEGQLRALVLDVLEEEPLAKGDPLWSTPGVYLSSHTAAPSHPGAVCEFFVSNLARYEAGEPLRGEVDFARGY